jgi:hypothetical protein
MINNYFFFDNNIMVLETVSGCPAFSVEQRNYYNRKQMEIKEKLGEFCFLDPEFKKFQMLSRFFDFSLFMRTDIKNGGAHPIHVLITSIHDFYKRYNEKMRELEVQKELNQITEEDYNDKLEQLKNNKLIVDAEFDLQAKKELREARRNKKIIYS